MFKRLAKWVDKHLMMGMFTHDVPSYVQDFGISYELNPKNNELEAKHNKEQVITRIKWFVNLLKNEERGSIVLLMGDFEKNQGNISFIKENETLVFSNIFSEMYLARSVHPNRNTLAEDLYKEIDENKNNFVFRLCYIHDEKGLDFILNRLPNIRNREILKRYHLPFKKLLRFATGAFSVNDEKEVKKL